MRHAKNVCPMKPATHLYDYLRHEGFGLPAKTWTSHKVIIPFPRIMTSVILLGNGNVNVKVSFVEFTGGTNCSSPSAASIIDNSNPSSWFPPLFPGNK